MKIQRSTLSEFCRKTIILLTAVLMCSFTVLSSYSWGSYVMIGCLVMIVALDVFQQGMLYRFKISRYLLFMVAFAVYTVCSCTVAINPGDSLTNAITLFEMILMIFVLEQFYSRQKNGVAQLLAVIKWTGFVIVIYSVLFYGVDTLIQMAALGERLDNRYANVNIIGLLAAVAVVIQVDEMLCQKKFKFASLFSIPAILVLAITQSRKALLLLILGVIAVIILHNVTGHWVKTIFKFIGAVIVIVVMFKVLLSLEVFGGIMDRLNDMIQGLMGVNDADASTKLRTEMIKVGWKQFFDTPLFGVGMGNAHYIAARELNEDTYLHNNFIELLVGGGLIGFCVYYAMYASVIISYIKFRKTQDKTYIVCLTLVLLMLLMDYGRVTYYDKMNYVYLLVFFLETEVLKKRSIKQSHKE